MLEFAAARRRFIELAPRLASECVRLEHCSGRVLAESIVAQRPLPEYDTSAMDGYALRVEDASDPRYRLAVEGEAAAGAAPDTLRPGTAMRIFTGARIPHGADAVVMQEHVRREANVVQGDGPVRTGQHIRRRGEELELGVEGLQPGTRIEPTTLALLSHLDRGEICVARSPRVTVLCTGTELRAPGTIGSAGSIPESNSLAIAGLARQAGAVVSIAPPVADEVQRVRQAIESAMATSDVLVTVGGVSVGDHDLVRPAFEALGTTLEVHQVAIKPGKPITLGKRGDALAIGLPGNPASAIITFALFGMPLLRAMQGDRAALPTPAWVPLASPIPRDAKRFRAVVGSLAAQAGRSAFVAHPNQSSGAALALGQSDGIVLLEAGPVAAEAETYQPFVRWRDF